MRDTPEPGDPLEQARELLDGLDELALADRADALERVHGALAAELDALLDAEDPTAR